MAVFEHTYLGIEINASEIHIVEVHGSWPNVRLTRALQRPTPENVLDGARIVDPVALGDCVRDMVQTMKPGTRDVVLGLPGKALLTRTIDLPPVPDHEARIILAGELSHYQTLQENVETFDYVTLGSTSKTPQGGKSVLVMAAEERIISGYADVVERAGLRLLALEPLPIALLRTLSTQLQAHPNALCLLVHHGDIEIAICEMGQLRMFRRLDVSSSDLITSKSSTGVPIIQSQPTRTLFGEPDETEVEPDVPTVDSPMNLTALRGLALELQRSLEYYTCEFAPANPIATILVASPHGELNGLPDWLADTLSMTVLPATMPVDESSDGSHVHSDNGPEPDPRCAAVGLAMREMPGLPAEFPRLNLSRQRRRLASESTLRRRLAGALAAAIALIFIGSFIAFRVGLRANKLDHAVSHLKEDIQEMQWDKQNRLDAFEIRSTQLLALSQEGFAFPRYMDAIADASGSQTGLLEVTLNHNGQFGVMGEAASEQGIIATLEGMKRCGYLSDTTLVSFDSTQSTQSTFNQARVIRFQITSHLAGFVPPQTVASAAASSGGR